jgi:type IV secretory pathway VirJ component
MAKSRNRALAVAAALVALAVPGTLALGDYFGTDAEALVPSPTAPPRPPLAAVLWTGDMGLNIGVGSGIVDGLIRSGVPVLTVSSPVRFRFARDEAFARRAVAASLRDALNRTGASRVALVGYSFGADILGATVGSLDPTLRARISSVVLAAPGADVYFQANPFGIAYLGRPDSDPARTIPLLRGLPVSCIHGLAEEDSLCARPVMRRARLTGIPGGHLLIGHRDELDAAVVAAVLQPPGPMP